MQIKTLLITSFCLAALFLNSCSHSEEKKLSGQQSQFVPQNYLDKLIPEFKVNFFCSCLREANQNSHAIKEVLNQDNSIASDFPLGIENYQLIDSLARKVNESILQDSIQLATFFCGDCKDKEEFERKRANGKIGRRIMTHCLDFYESEELDSIARQAFRE